MLDVFSNEEIMNEYVLCKIIRYNNRCKLQNESVAEHTCFVSLFCLKILAKLHLDHETERKVLILAALHDAAESRTSDIPHDVKANYPEMQNILNKIEENYYEEVWKEYKEDVYKPGDLCYNILKLADSYSVYQYCLNEKALGNVSDVIYEITRNSMLRIKKYTDAINQMMKRRIKNMSIQNGYKGIDVDIISYTKHPAKIMWDMLKQTWIKLQDIEYDPDNEIVANFISDSLEKRLNPTPQETVLIQAVFKNISRVNLAQLTRHRGWLFQVESQMPQHVNHNVIIPLNIINSEFCERAVKLIEESQKLYDDMTKGNDDGKEHTVIPYQDARYLLMHGQTCDASCSFTLPQLVNVCGQRLENNTADEINYAFRILLVNLRDAIEHDKEMDALDKLVYRYNLDKCDCFGAAAKKCFTCDNVFGNSFKRFADANEHVTHVTENCKFNFKKSAWYAELKRIYNEEQELLLPGEKEMIESWED